MYIYILYICIQSRKKADSNVRKRGLLQDIDGHNRKKVEDIR